MQTSTITVAVLRGPRLRPLEPTFSQGDVEEHVYRASGKGGQNRNKVATAIRLIHKQTGIIVQAERERSQDQNRSAAWKELTRRLELRAREAAHAEEASTRKKQVGSGERGDKRRTIAVQRDDVVDHESGWQTSYKKYAKGDW